MPFRRQRLRSALVASLACGPFALAALISLRVSCTWDILWFERTSFVGTDEGHVFRTQTHLVGWWQNALCIEARRSDLSLDSYRELTREYPNSFRPGSGWGIQLNIGCMGHFSGPSGPPIRINFPGYQSLRYGPGEYEIALSTWVPLLFTGLIAASWIAPRVLARHRRHRSAGWRARGCCEACGYDLQGLPASRRCPECGCGTVAGAI